MKKCSYCGRENTDTATHCSECGTGEFTDAPDTSGDEDRMADALARDYPKLIVVVGIWMFFLPGLLVNLYVAFAAFTGEMGIVPGVVCLFISLGCAGVCEYALSRAIKNYKIHRDRFCREIAQDARAEAESLATSAGLNPS